jgi:hypothetical protein
MHDKHIVRLFEEIGVRIVERIPADTDLPALRFS